MARLGVVTEAEASDSIRVTVTDGGDGTDPAIRLMVAQLAFLADANADLDLAEHQRLIDACRTRTAERVGTVAAKPFTQ